MHIVKRIGSNTYNRLPKVGDKVQIHIKPYRGNYQVGIITKVLTRKQFHPHGHKVLIHTNYIGRIVQFVK